MISKILIATFLSLQIIIPLLTPDLFPFSSFPMFSSKVTDCTTLIKAKNSSNNYINIPITNKDWIYLANDKPKLGCMINQTGSFVIKNGEDSNTVPLNEILNTLKNNKIISLLELETFCPKKDKGNKISERSVLISPNNES